MRRPFLNRVPIPPDINRTFPECLLELPVPPGLRAVTMGQGQWDEFLRVCYDDGWLLIELDENENLIGVYQKDSELENGTINGEWPDCF